MDDEREEEVNGVRIEIVPVWKWLVKSLISESSIPQY